MSRARNTGTLAELARVGEDGVARAVLPVVGGGRALVSLDAADLAIPGVGDVVWRVSRNHRCSQVTSVQDVGGHANTVYLGRLILRPSPEQVVDHHDHDGCNNVRANLRACTKQQNCFNRNGPPRETITGVLGVGYRRGSYFARLRRDGRLFCSNGHATVDEARRERQRLEREQFGEFAPCLAPTGSRG